jgi:hypothetical protein
MSAMRELNRIALPLLLVASAAFASELAGGLTWKAPAAWKKQPDRPMRAATYAIPASRGDVEGAELGIFYFGPGQGGAVDANLQRWVGQFEQPDGTPSSQRAKTTRETVRGMEVTRVEVAGTYLAAGGPMMGADQPKKPGYRLLGAIVQGPEGAVFFKLTGPDRTVAAARADFQKLLSSVEGPKKKKATGK